MSLSPIGNPAWETIRGVRFAMQYGPSLVEILVTNAALDEIELVPQRSPLLRWRSSISMVTRLTQIWNSAASRRSASNK